ncbi:hypothetical protein V1525DRAFT_385576 [Lipomyces kononenkoae]|uniref:Uncharacterized protein n=1 Tax=Lipomyces kononenkoae TaxID=34357 RepID=A0ACC3T9F4_LIPKO
MSFMGSSAADCAVGRNPLSHLTKHLGQDQSLQRDRFAGSSSSEATSSAPGASMRLSHSMPLRANDRDMMERFMSSQSPSPAPHDVFEFDAMRREVMGIGSPPPLSQQPQSHGSPAPAFQQRHNISDDRWAQEFQTPQFVGPKSSRVNEWTAEYSMPISSASSSAMPTYAQPRMGYGIGSMATAGLYNSGSMMYNQPHMQGPTELDEYIAQLSRGKGKGRLVELDSGDWEEQFKSIEAEHERAATIEDTEQRNELNHIDRDLQDSYTGETLDETFHGDFENIWRGIQEQHMHDGTGQEIGNQNNIDLTYENLFAGDRFLDSSDLDRENPFAVEGIDGELQMPWDRDFEEYATLRSDAGNYQFELENRYMDPDMYDPFAEGVRIMETGGNLSEAALAFEAAVQKNPEHIEGWALLGAVQAQNEKEDPAIRALERAVHLDPNNQSALMNLAVSYINEGYENAAYATLERWIATKYPDIVAQARGQPPQLADVDRFRLHERVTELFLRAAQLSPEGMTMDADVQVGLGVLFYGNEEYDKAVDCFNTALSVRPDDPLLWNRLGATLANSHRSEEAIEAYYKALELRPSFVRARYNLGVSCINIGCYKEAAQHLLAALNMHRVPKGQPEFGEDDVLANQSTNLYDTLRRVFLAMDRRDLADKVVNGVDPAVFKDTF